MGLTERHPLLHQIVCQICSIGEILCHSPTHNILPHLHAPENSGINCQTELDGINGIKDTLLVLLQILVVSQWQALNSGQHSHEMAHNPTGFASYQLGYIRILLLRHHGRASAMSIIQLNKEELTGTPQNGFLTETGQMNHENGSRRQELHNIIPIRYSIQTVAIDSIKIQLLSHKRSVNWEGSTSQGTCSQRHNITALIYSPETVKIPLQHGEISHHMMGEKNRLGSLKMSIAWHNYITVLAGGFHQSCLHIQNQLLHLYNLTADEHMGVQSHLVVTAAGGMQSATSLTNSVSQSFLDIHMNIFQGNLKGEIALFNFLVDILQALDNIITICLRDNAYLGQHGSMGNGASNILIVHTLVKINGSLKIIYHLIGGLGKTTTPELLCHIIYLPFPASEHEPSVASQRG